MSVDILAVHDDVTFDESIAGFEFHTHTPYASSRYGNNDEIRIAVQQQDLYTLPCESVLYIEGRLTKKDGTSAVDAELCLDNNAMAFLFEEIRYELAGVEIARTRRLGVTSTMKNLLTFDTNEENARTITACWTHPSKAIQTLKTAMISDNGNFCFTVPLKMLMGFAEDYRHIVVNQKQELVLLRTATDTDALFHNKPAAATPAPTQTTLDYLLTLNKVYWKLPEIKPSDTQKAALLRHVEQDRPVSIAFRNWEIHEYPLLPQAQQQTWAIKTATELEKPRYIVLAFQTLRKSQLNKQSSLFDHCDLKNVKLYLNSQYYPYDNLNLSFATNRFGLLYDMYARFKSSYYSHETVKSFAPTMTPTDFKTYAPLIVIDCSKQMESVKSSTVDVRIEFESDKEFPSNTTAYCLILHDVIYEYTPLSGVVRRVV